MKGSVTKYAVKGTSRPKWRYRIYTGKNDDGKKIYEGRGGYDKQGAAADAMREHMAEIETRASAPSTPPAPAAPEWTLGSWLQHWLATYAPLRCQPKTLERYQQLAGYVTARESLAAAPLATLRHTAIEPELLAMLTAKTKRRKNISVRSIRHIAGLLSVALNEAFRLEHIPVNPMLRVKLPSAEKKEVRSLTPQQIQALRDACRDDWTFCMVELALASGARRGELLALTWSDVDVTTGALTINKSLEQTAAGLRIKTTKSEKPRVFRLPQAALVALRFHREQQDEHRRMFAADYREQGIIFAEPSGGYLQPDLVSQVIVRRLKKAGVANASMHTLRHSHASHLLSQGVPLPAVSARLGHADPNVTARIYSHALPQDDDRAANAWDEVVKGPLQ